MGGRLLHSSAGPNDLFALFEWDDVERAREFVASYETHEAFEWVGAVEEIRHWSAECCSYLDLPTDVEATWFIDPPYQGVKYGSYKHDYKAIDYQQLAAWCRSLPGQVIVCEQLGADWLPFRDCCEVSGMRGKMRGVAGAKSQEMIWTND